MTPTAPKYFRAATGLSLALALGLVALAFVGAPATAQQKGAPKAGAAPAVPGAGVRAQGQDVQFGQPAQPPQPNPDDEITSDPRQHMRNLIGNISAYGRSANPGFIVVTMGGLELLERVDPVDPAKRAPAATYIRGIDGVIARELYSHPPDERGDIKTDERVQAEKLRLADIGQKRGLRIWSIDYARDDAMARDAIRQAVAKSFIPFPSRDADYRFARIPPGRPLNENPNAVTGLNQARNFLMLTDTSAWDTQEQFALAVADTNYDALIVDVFHRGRMPFTSRTVDGLKYKKLGTRRLVLAYVNIGEAESYRFYWKPGWREGAPSFIAAPNEKNPDKYTVQFWDPLWREILFGNATSYVYGVISQGYDGVVLDGTEAYRLFEGER